LKKKLKKFFNNRNAWIKIQAHEQEYQEIEQEVQELELTERSQVLPQDVSIAHDILAQDVHVFHAHTTRSSTRIMLSSSTRWIIDDDLSNQ
jgi:hypothetical protein